MAERLTSALMGIVPLFIILPVLQNLMQKVQQGEFQLTDIFNLILPLALVGALSELFRPA